MSIELRLTDVNPPAEEPHRTIYHDLTNLPNPVIQGITIRYFNYDDVGLYFQITGSGAGYTFGTVNLGLLGTGLNAYKNLDNFASRAKPTGEVTETITLALKAYTDSGYTNLKWTFDRVVTVIFINSSDPSYTTNVLNNFDDGTVQGWGGEAEVGTAVVSAVTNYVLTTPYSLFCQISYVHTGSSVSWMGVYKSFTTPNKDIVYAIIDVRVSDNVPAGTYGKAILLLRVLKDTTVVINLGKLAGNMLADEVPRDRWLRIVVPLPKSTTLNLRVRMTVNYYLDWDAWMWLDDFKIISK